VRRGGFILLALPLGFLALVFYYPLGLILKSGLFEGGRLTLSPLREILSDPYFLHLIAFTIEQAALSTLASLAIGLPGAYLLTRYDFPGKRTIRSLTVIPFVLPAIAVALGFILFFGNSGYLNHFLMTTFHLAQPPLRLLYSLSGIVLAHAFYNAPIVTRMVNAAWEGLDPAIDEAAISLGAGRLRRFLGITLPRLAPALFSSAALVFVFTFLSFPIVLTLGGARYATIEVEIYTLIRTLLDYRLGSALILVETLLSLSFTYLYLRAEGRFAGLTRGAREVATRPLFHGRMTVGKGLLMTYLFFAVPFFLGPIVSILADSLRAGGAWTLANYRELFSLSYSPFLGSSPLRTVITSLLVGGISTLIALPAGTLVALFSARSRLPGRQILEALLMAPLAVSSVAIGFAVLRGFSGPPLRLGGTIIAIALAHAILTYPFVVRSLRPILEGLDPRLVEAARSLGASRTRAFFEVEFPLIGRGLLVAAVFAFALSMGEMSATIMLMRPGLSTIPVAIYALLSARQFGAASAMAVVLIGVTAFSFLAIDRLGGGSTRLGTYYTPRGGREGKGGIGW
jgi:thiamine transport system permease protein